MKRFTIVACLAAGCSAGGHFLPIGDGGVDFAQPGQQDGGGFDLALPQNQDLAQGQPDLAQGQPDLATPTECALVLNEVQTGSVNSPDEEFVELYNPCQNAVDLGNYKLAYRSAAGANDQTLTTFVAGLFAPGRAETVIGSATYTGASAATYNGGHLAQAGGGLALRDPNGNIVDSVGWGTATNGFVEAAVAPAPATSQSIERIPNGGDTDDNSTDFVIGGATTPGSTNF